LCRSVPRRWHGQQLDELRLSRIAHLLDEIAVIAIKVRRVA
jgi:hypothetical protein